mgnify:CR=1
MVVTDIVPDTVKSATVVVPVNVGDALLLLLFTAVWILVISTPIEVAFTILLGFPLGKLS